MRAKRAFVALILCALAIVSSAAGALTESQRMLLFSGGRTSSSLAAQGNFVQASYDLNKASLDSIATFSRAGNAMQFDSSGYLTYGPNNLLTQSNTFSDASWAKNLVTVTGGVSDPVGGSNASTITATGVNAFIYQGPTVAAGTRIASQLYVKRRTGSGSVFLYDQDGYTNTVDITASISGGGWVAINPSVLTASGSNAYIGVKINTSGDAVDVYAGVVAAVTYETAVRTQDQVITTAAAYYGPRFDYTYNGSSWVPAGLLVEGAATNSFFGSSDPTNWSKLDVTAPSGQTAPDGSTNAATITASAGGTYHYSYGVGATATASQARVVSVFVKQGTAPYVNFGISGDASWHVGWLKWSDLSTGATNGTVTVYPLGGGLYRLALAYTMTNAVSTQPYVGPDTASRATAPNYSAAGTETVTAWGMQDEPGTIPSSYIPTSSGVAATRAAESVPVSAAVLAALQGTNGTVFYEGEGTPVTLAVFVGSITGNYALYTNNAASVISYNTTTAITASGTYTQGALFRAGVSWSAAGRSIALSGGAVTTDANPIGAFGSGYLGSNGANLHVNNHIKSFAIYNSRLPDATLQSKSVVNAAY